MTNKTFIFHTDCGHGWLQVPIKDLVELELLREISRCSYCDEESVYLEEDRDAPIFINKFMEKNKDWKIDSGIEYIDHGDRAPCRNYNHYLSLEDF